MPHLNLKKYREFVRLPQSSLSLLKAFLQECTKQLEHKLTDKIRFEAILYRQRIYFDHLLAMYWLLNSDTEQTCAVIAIQGYSQRLQFLYSNLDCLINSLLRVYRATKHTLTIHYA